MALSVLIPLQSLDHTRPPPIGATGGRAALPPVRRSTWWSGNRIRHGAHDGRGDIHGSGDNRPFEGHETWTLH
jgi:hypothetical protein